VFKAWVSEECLVANSNAMQVLGGAGYTRDHPLEQYYRDNRLNPIHEGTNGIQAIDLVGRKATMARGRALALFRDRLLSTATVAREHGDAIGLRSLGDALSAADDRMRSVFATLGERTLKDGPRAALAHAESAMQLVGRTLLAWIWLEQAIAAARMLDGSEGEVRDMLLGTIATCRYVVEERLPETAHLAQRIADGSRALVSLDERWL
jgi:hypothetical protein